MPILLEMGILFIETYGDKMKSFPLNEIKKNIFSVFTIIFLT